MKKMMGLLICLIFISSGCDLAAGESQLPVKKEWTLVWSDEFDAVTLNTNDWGFDIGRGPNNDGFGSWSLESFTDKTDHVFLSNGNMVIKMEKDADSGSFFHSAQVTTKGKRTFHYGRIEARIKLPFGFGMWPGMCLFGTNIDSVGWPECGEIDVMEMRGGDHGNSNKTVLGTLHFRNGSADNSWPGKWTYETMSHVLPGGADLSDDFHVFGIVWDPDKIIFQFDGTGYYTNWIRAWYKSEFREPFYLYFNIKVGGEFFGWTIKDPADATASMPQTMVIDWIRHYQ